MRRKQSGAVLVISLIILFALTVLVLSGNKSVVMQEKMAMAVRDGHVTLEMSESGILDAETYIETLSDTDDFDNTNGLYSQDNGPQDIFASTTWAAGNTINATNDVSGTGLVAEYFIEYLGLLASTESSNVGVGDYGDKTTTSNRHAFKIVSRSTGQNNNVERIVVSYYGKSFE